MRAATLSTSLLFAIFALGAAACEDSPLEPVGGGLPEPAVPELDQAPSPADTVRWADGYLLAISPLAPSYNAPAQYSYNRSGGVITITRLAGYTGRYVATFRGLSALLGAKSTVQVTGVGSDNTFCKPMAGSLIADKVEVRCFTTATGSAADAQFNLLVLRKSASRAFAFAHQPTSANYTPQGAGSWNPAGTTKVVRYSLGKYQVVFNNLGTKITTNGGQVQVHAVASGKAHCKLESEWGGSPNLSVYVACYLPNGQPVDAKFTVLFTLPADRLSYTYSAQPSVSHTPAPFYTTVPGKPNVYISRDATGEYTVNLEGSGARLLGAGTAMVTALGEYEYGHCKISGRGTEAVGVRCFAPNGAPADSRFAVLLGS